ncbi:MAG: helicase HerA domain-containing protein [Salinigranum sp.]
MTEDTETITVANVSDGVGGTAGAKPGTPVSLPVVEILTGRGFVTGKSGSGKSNTASVIIENLLSNNFPVLIVDTDGEYYGLKEEFEILHVGADDECDIQVSPEHAEKIASLALEGNVPIILDVSGYLDEGDANELLLETTRHLFAKEKKLKKPFLMLVEECHEYIPEGGGLDETGKMLIKVGKRGRKHGLGIVGISQRPADVKKDYITQCDWLVWHRLTWGNDTKVVGRILGSEYADAIEEMGDGEGFLVTDWSESIRRVQFHRKETFDAGATPGLDDFERPELKSVSGDLVEELRDISETRERRESELADLRQELDKKETQIAQLRSELEDARDMSRMADQFAQALLGRAEAPYRGGAGRNLARPEEAQTALGEYQRRGSDADGDGAEPADDAEAAGARGPGVAASDGGATTADGAGGDGAVSDDGGDAGAEEGVPEVLPSPYPGFGGVEPTDGTRADGESTGRADRAREGTSTPSSTGEMTRRAVLEALAGIDERLDDVERGMLAYYREHGVGDPVDAHVAAGGTGDRNVAYSRNRTLRRAGLLRHAGRGLYAYAVADLVREEYADRLTDAELAETVRAIEETFAVVDGGADRTT